MKSLSILTLLFALPLLAEEENPFDNWFFEFFEGESEMFGTFLGPDGEEFDQAAGKMTTIIDRKNIKSVSSIVAKSKTQKKEFASVSTTTPKGKNTFLGVVKYPNGQKSNYTMTLLDGKKYRTIVHSPNGNKVKIEGKLKNESTIQSTELIEDKNGNLLWKSLTTYKRAKKPKKKE